jgi:TolA-binding protein
VLKLTGPADVPGGTTSGGGSGRTPSAPPTADPDEGLGIVPLPAGGSPSRTASPEPRSDGLAEAQALVRRGSWAAAAVALSRFLKHHPGHPSAGQASLDLAECFLRLRKPGQAAWVLRQQIRGQPSAATTPPAYLKLADCEETLGQRAQAVKLLTQLMELFPRTREAAAAAVRLRRLK